MGSLGICGFLRGVMIYLLVTLGGATVTQAKTRVASEFELLLPRPFLQDLVDQQWQIFQKDEFTFSWAVPDRNYATPDGEVLLSGLQLDAATKFHEPQLEADGESVSFVSKDLRADLSIQVISIDQYIEREVGGVIGRFRIQARCENVRLKMKPGQGIFTMRLRPTFNRAVLGVQVEDVSLHWTTAAWELAPLTCTGAEGFEDLIAAEILRLSGDDSVAQEHKNILLEFARSFASAHVIDLSKPRELTSPWPGLKLSLQMQDFVVRPESAVLRGVLRVDFIHQGSGDEIFLKLPSGASDSDSVVTAQLRIPESFVLVLARQLFASHSWKKRLSSEQIPGFRTLMSSRWTQFFVWRELLRFSKSAEFLFDVSPAKDPLVKGSKLRYQVRTAIAARMYAPKGGHYVPFMDFNIPFTSRVHLGVGRGNLTADFREVNLELQGQWVPSYLRTYHPYRKFAAAKIQPRLRQAAEGTSFTYALPVFPLGDLLNLRLEKLKSSSGGVLEFYLKTGSGAVSPTPQFSSADAIAP